MQNPHWSILNYKYDHWNYIFKKTHLNLKLQLQTASLRHVDNLKTRQIHLDTPTIEAVMDYTF